MPAGLFSVLPKDPASIKRRSQVVYFSTWRTVPAKNVIVLVSRIFLGCSWNLLARKKTPPGRKLIYPMPIFTHSTSALHARGTGVRLTGTGVVHYFSCKIWKPQLAVASPQYGQASGYKTGKLTAHQVELQQYLHDGLEAIGLFFT